MSSKKNSCRGNYMRKYGTLMITSYETSTLFIFGTLHRCTIAIYVATLLLLLTSPPSSALDAIEPPTRPQAKSSQEILNGKPFYEYIPDLLCRQQIKLFQVVSTSEFHEY